MKLHSSYVFSFFLQNIKLLLTTWNMGLTMIRFFTNLSCTTYFLFESRILILSIWSNYPIYYFSTKRCLLQYYSIQFSCIYWFALNPKIILHAVSNTQKIIKQVLATIIWSTNFIYNYMKRNGQSTYKEKRGEGKRSLVSQLTKNIWKDEIETFINILNIQKHSEKLSEF